MVWIKELPDEIEMDEHMDCMKMEEDEIDQEVDWGVMIVVDYGDMVVVEMIEVDRPIFGID